MLNTLSSKRQLPPLKLPINIDLTSYLPEPISQKIKNNPRNAKSPFFIPNYDFETYNTFRNLVEKIKSHIPKFKKEVGNNPVLYIYNHNLKLVEKVGNIDDMLSKYYISGKLKKNYTIKISKEIQEPKNVKKEKRRKKKWCTSYRY